MKELENCSICPHKCMVNREQGKRDVADVMTK